MKKIIILITILLFVCSCDKDKEIGSTNIDNSLISIIPSKEPFVSPIDFNLLFDINSHIIGQIDILNADISFPIVQHPTDDSYYLRRDINQNDSNSGVIYIENWNNLLFNDINTVIYGHNNDRKEFFGKLQVYYDNDYVDANKDIVIYTPGATLEYEIIGKTIYDDRHIPYTFDSNDLKEVNEFISSANNENSYFPNFELLKEDDKIITLSTCYGDWLSQVPTERFLVIAKLKNIDN